MKVKKFDIKKAGFSRPAGNFYAMQLSNYRAGSSGTGERRRYRFQKYNYYYRHGVVR